MFMIDIQPQVEPEFNKFNPWCLPESTLSCDYSPVESRIGQLISQRLEEKGKIQRWLAEQVGVSDNAVSKWIKSGKVSKKNALKVSEFLEIPVAVLLSEHDEDLLLSANTHADGVKVIFTPDNVVPLPPEPEWPFPRVPLDRIRALNAEQIGFVQGRLLSAIDEAEADATKARPSKRAS